MYVIDTQQTINTHKYICMHNRKKVNYFKDMQQIKTSNYNCLWSHFKYWLYVKDVKQRFFNACKSIK